MKKSLLITALLIVNLFMFNELLKAGVESNNLTINGKVLYKNSTTPVKNAVVKLYVVNEDQVTYRVLESVVVNDKGEYAFTSTQLNVNDKVRIGAYANDILEVDRSTSTGNLQTTDQLIEIGAYANDLTIDRLFVSEIYNKTSELQISGVSSNNSVNLFINGGIAELNNANLDGGGIGTYPRDPSINQNYPNPFNPTTNITFGIPQQEYVTLKVYDMSGKLVAELVNEVKEKGFYTVKFDGSKLASGFYIYRITAGSFSSIKKMSLIK